MSTTRTDRKRFASGVLLLAVCSMIAKLLGAVYRIPLTNLLGAQGIGQYQLVFPLFAFLLAVVCGAMPIALARTVAAQNALDDNAAIRTYVRAATQCMLWAGIGGSILALALALPLARLQSQASMAWGYVAIAPAIAAVALANVCKGWFLGHGDTRPNAIVQLVEQAIKLTAGLLLAAWGAQFGVVWGVVGALAGVTVSEIVGALVCWIWMARELRAMPRFELHAARVRQARNALVRTMTPIAASGLLFPTIAFADSLMLVQLLVWGGADKSDATAQYGLLTGPVNSLVNMPVVLSLSIAVAIVPAIGSMLARNDYMQVKSRTSRSILCSAAIGAPCLAGLIVFARPILRILYPALSDAQTDTAVVLLRVQSVNVLLLSQLEIFNATLQGMGRSKAVVLNVAIGGALKLAVQAVSVPLIGIVGACVASVTFYGVAWILNWSVYREMVGKNQILLQNVGKILLSGVIIGAVMYACSVMIASRWTQLIVGASAGGAIYCALLVAWLGADAGNLPLLRKTRSRP